MIEHFILLTLAIISFLFAVDKNKFRVAIFISSVLFWIVAYILVTFRAETIGNDTRAYVDFFEKCLQFDSYQEFIHYGWRFEVGYATFSYMISRIVDDYTGFFAICDVLYFGATIYFFREFSFNKNAWILPWFLIGLYYNLFNTLRASMAMVFVLLFASAFLQKRRGSSIALFLVSASMHVSALTTGVMFFLKSKYISKLLSHEITLIIVFGIAGIFFSQVMSLLPDYYSHYYFDSQYGEGPTRLASIVNFVMISALYFFSRCNKTKEWEHHDFFKIMFLFTIGMSFFGLFIPLFNRVEFFFRPFMLIYVLNTFRYQKIWRKCSIIGVFCLFAVYQVVAFIMRPEWLGIFPYSFK